jgi:galactose mutarotase-like enzyme
MKTWTLVDVDNDVYLDDLHVTSGEFGVDGSMSIRKRRLRGGLREGVDVVEIDNGALRFTVVPTRGMGLWRAALGNLDIAWQSPVRGPVHPAFVPVFEPSGVGWLSGFDELLVRCGLESNGAPEFDKDGQLEYALHGRIANLPANHVEVSFDADSRTIAVTGIVDESRLFGHKLRLRSTYITQLGEPRLKIIDEVTNLSALPSDMQLLYHINFGAPLATPGSRLVAPIETLAPRDAHSASDAKTWNVLRPAEAALAEFAHFAELAADANGRTRAMLAAADGARGVSLEFNRRQLPYLTLWKSHHLPADGYVTGLEPATGFPNMHCFEEKERRVLPMAPGQTRRFDITMEVHPSLQSVSAAAADIATLSRGVEPTILSKPKPGWSL